MKFTIKVFNKKGIYFKKRTLKQGIGSQFYRKKGQFLIYTFYFLMIAILCFYFLETTNVFITQPDYSSIVNNIVYETCFIAVRNNGSALDTKLKMFRDNLSDYCSLNSWFCDLNITTNTTLPPNGNWSLLNYSYYNFTLNYNISNIYGNYSFKCHD